MDAAIRWTRSHRVRIGRPKIIIFHLISCKTRRSKGSAFEAQGWVPHQIDETCTVGYLFGWLASGWVGGWLGGWRVGWLAGGLAGW